MKIPPYYRGPYGQIIRLNEDGTHRKVSWKWQLFWIVLTVVARWYADQAKKENQAREIKRAELSAHMKGFTEGLREGTEIGRRYPESSELKAWREDTTTC